MRLIKCLCSSLGYLSEKEARQYVQQVVTAIDYIHKMGIVNRYATMVNHSNRYFHTHPELVLTQMLLCKRVQSTAYNGQCYASYAHLHALHVGHKLES